MGTEGDESTPPLAASESSHEYPAPIFVADTLDDLTRLAFDHIRERGQLVHSTRGDNHEVRHMQLTLLNPRARLSRTRARGKPFSALGEFCWYMTGSDQLADIKPFIRIYEDDAEDGVLAGAYGPRIVQALDPASPTSIISMLRSKPETRQAVIPIARASDFVSGQIDVPCTVYLQFFLRDGLLELATSMRSNDLVLGLTHDVFAFTMIQEFVATELGVGLGRYVHSIGSAHIYDSNDSQKKVSAFLEAGYTDSRRVMPPMPADEPFTGLRELLDAGRLLISGVDPIDLTYGTGYWADLARLLGCHFLAKNERQADIVGLADGMSEGFRKCFDVFLLEKTGGSGQ